MAIKRFNDHIKCACESWVNTAEIYRSEKMTDRFLRLTRTIDVQAFGWKHCDRVGKDYFKRALSANKRPFLADSEWFPFDICLLPRRKT